MSKATAMCVGRCCVSRLISIAMKPWMAFVCWPSRLTKLSTGRA